MTATEIDLVLGFEARDHPPQHSVVANSPKAYAMSSVILTTAQTALIL